MKITRIAVSVAMMVFLMVAVFAEFASAGTERPNAFVAYFSQEIDQADIGIPISETVTSPSHIVVLQTSVPEASPLADSLTASQTVPVATAVGAMPTTFKEAYRPTRNAANAEERDGYRDPAYKPNIEQQTLDPTGFRGFGSDHNARAEI